jgi:Xaa-Pro dipeptidase
MSIAPAELYPEHHAVLLRRYETAMERHGLEGIAVFAGSPRPLFQDDQNYPFSAGPWYRQWVPARDHVWSLIELRPGRRPRLVSHQPQDYWHVPPAPPAGFWTEAFDIATAGSPARVRAQLPDALDRWALLGDAPDELLALGFGAVNPPGLVARLQFDRLFKTDYEVACMREANRRAARGHLAARDAFLAGASEFEIHLEYLRAVGQTADELPYPSIVALNEHGATLHYDVADVAPPSSARSFLIDAGADCNGYAADITRTWAAPAERGFAELIRLLDEAQQALVGRIVPGLSYVDLHLQMHETIGGILAAAGLVDMAPADMVEAGVTAAFFPHGLGHHLGLQVHDVAGKTAGPEGPALEQPRAHPFLRNLRPVEAGNVFTIEPGIYFIPQLLDELRGGPAGAAVDWKAVAALAPCGGVRIEDDVAVGPAGIENLTRAAFAELGA